eukprot:4432674-Alexandrium_andersonii.AAC.1
MGRARLALALGALWGAWLARSSQRLEGAQGRPRAAVQAMDVRVRRDALAGIGRVQEGWAQWESAGCTRLHQGQASCKEVHGSDPGSPALGRCDPQAGRAAKPHAGRSDREGGTGQRTAQGDQAHYPGAREAWPDCPGR